MSPRINHVSINARDLRESVDFYVDLLKGLWELHPQSQEQMQGRLFVSAPA